MESQPQNPEFRNNPENFRPCIHCMCNELKSSYTINFQYFSTVLVKSAYMYMYRNGTHFSCTRGSQ